MTTYYHGTISGAASGNLNSNIPTDSKLYVKTALNITGLTSATFYFENPEADGVYITISPTAIQVDLSRNDGEATDTFTETMAIAGNEVIIFKIDSLGSVNIIVDDAEVLADTVTAPWAAALATYGATFNASSGDFEVWAEDTTFIQSGIITEGYGNPVAVITEGYGAGSEVIPDPPEPPTSVYVVTVAAGLGGSTDVLPDTYNVISGGTFTVTATPSTGYGFLYYDTGTEHISTNPYTFTVTASVTLTPIYGISALDPTDRYGNLVSDIMTPAICGTARAGFFRAGVTVPVFDGALEGIVAKIPVETVDGVKTLPTFRQALNYLKGE